MSSNLIINYLREQEQLKLIFAKNNILMCALEGLVGYTINIEESIRVFEQILESSILDGEIEKELIEKHFELTSDEDLRIPASDEIESLCETIASLNCDITENDIILDVCIKNKTQDSGELSIKQIEELILEWINFVEYSEKTIFGNKIHEILRIEEKKSVLIEKLENEFSPIRNMANKLLLIDSVKKDWYSQLDEIANESVYSNNFHEYFSSPKNKLIKHYSSTLNADEKNELVSFYNLIIDRLSIIH